MNDNNSFKDFEFIENKVKIETNCRICNAVLTDNLCFYCDDNLCFYCDDNLEDEKCQICGVKLYDTLCDFCIREECSQCNLMTYVRELEANQGVCLECCEKNHF
uniref:Uncharacterized protein n=1 Tax=viral metagenome TaxID=1070528 RepID=A0A6C0LVS6_9ZZZZ